MGKQLIWILAFLFLAFLGDRIIGFIFSEITKSSHFRYSRSYNSKDNADILFVGNSRGLNFYQPEAERLTGQQTMNLSYNGMPADLAKCLVMDYLDGHNPPKVMIVDVTLCDRENDNLKSGFNLYTPYSFRLDTLLKGMRTNGDSWAGRKVVYGGNLSHLYRYNSEIFQRVLFHRNKTDKDWIVDRVINESAAKDTAFHSYKVRMFPNMVAHLKEMVDYAKSKGVDVKLVINPYFPAFAEAMRDSFLGPLKTYVETETGMPVHDFSTALQERDEIGDYQHANKKGSTHYMNILFEQGFFNSSPNVNAMTTNVSPLTLLPSVDTVSNKADTFSNFSSQMQTPYVPEQPAILEHIEIAPTPKRHSTLISTNINVKKRKKHTSIHHYSEADDYGFSVDTVGLGTIRQ